MMQDKYITVTQLTKYIKFKIDTDENLNQVFLKGEISNFKAHTRGHFYFTIKDENSRINAVMFASSAAKLKFMPQDGMKVLVTGKISVYEVTGGYQIYVYDMVEDGIGNLYVAYEQLKEKLSKEGLFDTSHKKPIPKYPEKIGIITAPTGAAIRDILSTIKRRFPLAQTYLFPSLVQGANAAPEIVKQIMTASQYPLDVLIIGRGGGSIEDMWCFNDEAVARAIYHCPIPTISAVGHEIDFTIADFVADLRAPTPTGAAEMAVPNKDDVSHYIEQLKLRCDRLIKRHLEVREERLTYIKNSYIMKNPLSIYEVKEQKFDTLFDQLLYQMDQHIKNAQIRLAHALDHYLLKNPQKIYQERQKQLQEMTTKLYYQYQHLVVEKENHFQQLLSKLDPLNPLYTMKRGYAIIKKDNTVITSVSQIQVQDRLQLTLSDGTITTEVEEVHYG